jgi:hypothetical protein
MTPPPFVARLRDVGTDNCNSLRSGLHAGKPKEGSGNESSSKNLTSDGDQTPLLKSSVVSTPAHDKEKVVGEGLFGMGPM